MKSQSHICLATLILALSAVGWLPGNGAAAETSAVNPTGTWKWIAPANPDGRIPEITFTLKLQGETLTGTVNKSTGTTTIINGLFKGDEVSFQTVFEGKCGKRTTTYSGKLSGDTIKGKIETDGGGPKNSTDWEAKRVKE